MGDEQNNHNGEEMKDEDVGAEGDETTDDEGGVDTPPPARDDEEQDGNYEVDQIVDMECQRRWKCPVKFRVRWVGYGEKDDSWLPASELNCEDLIKEFLEISGRTSEYRTAMAPKKRAGEDSERRIETRRKLNKFSYSELDEDEDEVMPAGTRSRKVKTKAEKKVVRPPPVKRRKNLPPSNKKPKRKDEPEEFEVEAVVDHRVRGRFTEYKVRWKGFGPRDDSWLAEAELNCDALLNKYFNATGANQEETYEVEAIMGLREVKGRTEYKVRWKGWSAKYDSWLSEEELNCPDLLKAFLSTLEKLEKQEDWQVEKILESKEKQGKTMYLIQWKGWGPKYNTWEPEENLSGCQQILDRFIEGQEKEKEKTPKAGRKKREERASTVKLSDTNNDGRRSRSQRPGKNRSYSEFYNQ